jgi:hypothetical protein
MPSRESSLRNLKKARARWRPPLPWRSSHESGVIWQLLRQWFSSRSPDKWSGRA